MITLSEERKESRRANDELWDKKFTDNEIGRASCRERV